MGNGDPQDQLIRAAVKALAEPIAAFLSRVIGVPATELGQILGDQLRVFRYTNSLRLFKRACEIAAEHGIEPQEVPKRTLLPILQSGSLEEEPDMAERWAHLLANAAGNPDSVPPMFPRILTELSPQEAAILAEIGVSAEVAGAPLFKTMVDVEDLPTFNAMESPLREAALGNLFRNSLVTGRDWPNHGEANSERSDGPGSNRASLRLTEIGFLFLVACGDANADPEAESWGT